MRLHTKLLGHPIVGDFTYTGDTAAPRMMLHAQSLRLPRCNDVLHGKQGIEVEARPAQPFGNAFVASVPGE